MIVVAIDYQYQFYYRTGPYSRNPENRASASVVFRQDALKYCSTTTVVQKLQYSNGNY